METEKKRERGMEKLVQKPCEVSKGVRGKNVYRGFAAVVTGSMGVPGRDTIMLWSFSRTILPRTTSLYALLAWASSLYLLLLCIITLGTLTLCIVPLCANPLGITNLMFLPYAHFFGMHYLLRNLLWTSPPFPQPFCVKISWIVLIVSCPCLGPLGPSPLIVVFQGPYNILLSFIALLSTT
ncbi:Uncharacterized protein TCM_022859 [Theobroma cacao]|uniref:Uncharacterized protein n=1 Tax=Theobroma cacao TaxID=3641 RepID=A0A061F1N5_THECC|nr:Uncharacterized protein TCM_022859 [Theobroma cacao]